MIYAHQKALHHLCHQDVQSNNLFIVLPLLLLKTQSRLEGQHRNY